MINLIKYVYPLTRVPPSTKHYLEFKSLAKVFEATEKVSKLKGEEFTIFNLNNHTTHNITSSKGK
jgi:hypothetical protein